MSIMGHMINDTILGDTDITYSGEIALISSVPHSNVVAVDGNIITEETGVAYKTWASADTWITTNQTLDTTNIWKIKITGDNSENIISRPFIHIDGDRDTTRLKGRFMVDPYGNTVDMLTACVVSNCNIYHLDGWDITDTPSVPVDADLMALEVHNCNILDGDLWLDHLFIYRSKIRNITFYDDIDIASFRNQWWADSAGSIIFSYNMTSTFDLVINSIIKCGKFINSSIYNCSFEFPEHAESLGFYSSYIEIGLCEGVAVNTSGAVEDEVEITIHDTHIAGSIVLRPADTIKTFGGSIPTITQDGATWIKEDLSLNTLVVDGAVTSGGIVTSVGSKHNIVAKTDDFTLTTANEIVTFDGTDKTAELPAAASIAGTVFTIKNINSSALTIDGNATETIDGSNTISVAQWETKKVVSDGTNWLSI